MKPLATLAIALIVVAPSLRAQGKTTPERPANVVRFATFNVSLNRNRPGRLLNDLKSADNDQARRIAAIIQRVRPDVLLLNEFDYSGDRQALRAFQNLYLARSQFRAEPITFPYHYLGPVNTGEPSGMDLNRDGSRTGPNDAFGFGRFPGQYGMVVLSRFPIQPDQVRTFRKFRWIDMPGAKLPFDRATGRSWYTARQLRRLRLSSKSHWDVPITISGRTVHFLVCHPTPPAFDGAEDRNGCRNHDEIRLFADYISPNRSGYIVDDAGKPGGLSRRARFVIGGDLNSDPHDGGSRHGAIRRLLDSPAVNASPVPAGHGGTAKAAADRRINTKHTGNPAHDTADFSDRTVGNLRVDYVLPGRNLTVRSSGVFWPRPGDEGSELIRASDHRLVWVDVEL